MKCWFLVSISSLLLSPCSPSGEEIPDSQVMRPPSSSLHQFLSSSCLWSCVILGLFIPLTWHFGDDLIIAEPALVQAKTVGRVCPGPTGENVPSWVELQCHTLFCVTPEMTSLDKNAQPLLLNHIMPNIMWSTIIVWGSQNTTQDGELLK